MVRVQHVVFVTRSNGVGGTEKHLSDLVQRLVGSAHEVTILTLAADPYSTRFAKEKGVRVIPGPVSGRFTDVWNLFRALKPDSIVFVNGDLGLFHWKMYIAARLSGARRVAAIEHLIALMPDGGPDKTSLDGVAGRFARLLRRRITTRLPGFACHVTLCVSDAVRNRLVGEYLYPPRKTITERNGVDLAWFSRASHAGPIPSILAGRPAGHIAVCIARFVPQKRIDVLVEAMRKVVSRFPTGCCVLVGGGFLEGELRAKVRELSLEHSVLFAGETADVRPYLAASSIFVLPSEREGLPLVLLEAMAFGLPCVATEAGGNREVIEDGVNGFIVPAGNAPRLAEAIEKLFEAPEEMARMGRNARRIVEERFDLEKTMSGVTAAILGRTA